MVGDARSRRIERDNFGERPGGCAARATREAKLVLFGIFVDRWIFAAARCRNIRQRDAEVVRDADELLR